MNGQVAIYARVSSEKQAESHTIDSQLAALRERVAADGFELLEELQFVDNGYSGTTLIRPGLSAFATQRPWVRALRRRGLSVRAIAAKTKQSRDVVSKYAPRRPKTTRTPPPARVKSI